MKKPENVPDNTIFSFRWENYRGFGDTGWIHVRPFTIYIGPNNCGKTSLIEPFLIFKQTLESRDTMLPLRLKGKYIDAGDYKSIINDHDVEKHLRTHIYFPQRMDNEHKRFIAVLSLSFKKSLDLIDIIQLESLELSDFSGEIILKRTIESDGNYTFYFFKKFEDREKEFKEYFEKAKPNHFLFETSETTMLHLNEFLSILVSKIDRIIEALEKNKKSEKKIKGFSEELPKTPSFSAFLTYLSILTELRVSLDEIFNKINYIGPLREHPQRYYEKIGERPYSVGAIGQFTPDLLLRLKNERTLTLVNEWLKKFGFSGEIDIEEHGSELISINSKDVEKKPVTNIADLGFGISQILPLITQGIWMDDKGILITEQPEIHLNPKLQCTLADFLVELVNSHKNIILETHSEHLLMRLRRLIADPDNPIKNSDVALYYLEKDGGKVSVIPIPIEENGNIRENKWPKDFFDESFKEALNLAEMQSKRRKCR